MPSCVLWFTVRLFAAHKLVANGNGELMFFSKENFSNGSIGTVDITYPSSPLFLKYNVELAKGLMISFSNTVKAENGVNLLPLTM